MAEFMSDDRMRAIASRNLRAFLTKASFVSNVDRQAALNCVEVLEQSTAARQDESSETAAEPVLLTPDEVKRALDIILECAGLDFISGECKSKFDRHYVYNRLCEAANLLVGEFAPTTPAPSADVVKLLQRWLAFEADAAGVTPALICDKAAFKAFIAEVDATKEALIADTRAALAAPGKDTL